MLKAKYPSIAFRWMKKIGILSSCFSEIDDLSQVEQGEKYHPEGDVFEHTMLSLDVLSISERDIILMLAILYHDIGKAYVKRIKKADRVHFYGHENEGAKRVGDFLTKITDNKEIISQVKALIKYHMRPLDLKNNLSKKAVRKLVNQVDIPRLLKLHKADTLGRKVTTDISYMDDILKVYNQVKDEVEPIIKGRHLIELGVKPGKKMGEILKEIYDAQLNGEFSNLEEGLEYSNYILKEDCF